MHLRKAHPTKGRRLSLRIECARANMPTMKDGSMKLRRFAEPSPGHLDWHIVRPISGLSETYTVIIRFDTRAHLQEWMESPARTRLIEKVQPLFVTGDDFFISSGLDFWFTPGGAKAKVPVRWKQYLVTWSAIYPLVLGVPLVVRTGSALLGVPNNHLLTTLVVTGIVVFLMVYVVMPRYTKLIQRWLFT